MKCETFKTIAKITLPIAIGIIALIWLFSGEFSLDVFKQVDLNRRLLISLFFVVIFVIGRDWGMCWRFKILTDDNLSWRSSLRVTMLCEFTSTITPTSVGGGTLSMIFLNREGINWGHATTITMTTLFLDELFFVITCPLIVLFFSSDSLFGFADKTFTHNLQILFWVIYIAIAVWTLLLFVGIFVKPKFIRNMLMSIFSCKLLYRWKNGVDELSSNMFTASIRLKSRSKRWWTKSFVATSVSWLSRYLLVNALFWGLYPAADQIVVFVRQFIVWTILTVSPTPGGSGVSEYLFNVYYGDIIAGGAMILMLALLWRIFSYYIYIILGIFMMPSFLTANKVKKSNKIN